MDRFFRYVYSSYSPVAFSVNPIRLVQAALCAFCVGIVFIIIYNVHDMKILIKAVIGVTAAAFLTITLADITVNCLKKPIFWPTWLVFATTASLSYFLSAGNLLAHMVTDHIKVGIAFFIITGIVFLLDVILIVCGQQSATTSVYPLYPEDLEEKKSKHEDEDYGVSNQDDLGYSEDEAYYGSPDDQSTAYGEQPPYP